MVKLDSMNYSEELDDIENSAFVRTVEIIVFIVYVMIIFFGVPSNIYVLYRLHIFAKVDNEKYINGSGAGLSTMALADLLSVLSICIQHLLAFITSHSSELVSSLLCKMLLFTTHTATSVSIWSWTAVSTLRYLAVRHPFFHLRLYRILHRAIMFYVLTCSATNLWLLTAVYHRPESGCTLYLLVLYDIPLNRWFELADCIWSFCIPLSAILYMDTTVLLCSSSERRTRRMEQKLCNGYHTNKKTESVVRKFLIIALIDLLLNTPENCYRLAAMLNMPALISDNYYFSVRMISQVLYFSQFAFNAAYLSVFVYDKNIRPRISSISSNRSTEMKLLRDSRRALKQGEVTDSASSD